MNGFTGLLHVLSQGADGAFEGYQYGQQMRRQNMLDERQAAQLKLENERQAKQMELARQAHEAQVAAQRQGQINDLYRTGAAMAQAGGDTAPLIQGLRSLGVPITQREEPVKAQVPIMAQALGPYRPNEQAKQVPKTVGGKQVMGTKTVGSRTVDVDPFAPIKSYVDPETKLRLDTQAAVAATKAEAEKRQQEERLKSQYELATLRAQALSAGRPDSTPFQAVSQTDANGNQAIRIVDTRTGQVVDSGLQGGKRAASGNQASLILSAQKLATADAVGSLTPSEGIRYKASKILPPAAKKLYEQKLAEYKAQFGITGSAPVSTAPKEQSLADLLKSVGIQ